MNKQYQGTRDTDHRTTVEVVRTDGHTVLAYPLPHVVRHSPDGFEWGYGGSGPSDLALAILADVLGCEPEPKVYQRFKFDFVANWGDRWMISERVIRGWLENGADL